MTGLRGRDVLVHHLPSLVLRNTCAAACANMSTRCFKFQLPPKLSSRHAHGAIIFIIAAFPTETAHEHKTEDVSDMDPPFVQEQFTFTFGHLETCCTCSEKDGSNTLIHCHKGQGRTQRLALVAEQRTKWLSAWQYSSYFTYVTSLGVEEFCMDISITVGLNASQPQSSSGRKRRNQRDQRITWKYFNLEILSELVQLEGRTRSSTVLAAVVDAVGRLDRFSFTHDTMTLNAVPWGVFRCAPKIYGEEDKIQIPQAAAGERRRGRTCVCVFVPIYSPPSILAPIYTSFGVHG